MNTCEDCKFFENDLCKKHNHYVSKNTKKCKSFKNKYDSKAVLKCTKIFLKPTDF